MADRRRIAMRHLNRHFPIADGCAHLEQASPTENADMSEVAGTVTEDNVEHTARMLQAAADGRKCWACSCLRHASEVIDPGEAKGPKRGSRSR